MDALKVTVTVPRSPTGQRCIRQQAVDGGVAHLTAGLLGDDRGQALSSAAPVRGEGDRRYGRCCGERVPGNPHHEQAVGAGAQGVGEADAAHFVAVGRGVGAVLGDRTGDRSGARLDGVAVILRSRRRDVLHGGRFRIHRDLQVTGTAGKHLDGFVVGLNPLSVDAAESAGHPTREGTSW